MEENAIIKLFDVKRKLRLEQNQEKLQNEEDVPVVTILAPMVRYSKLPFRRLVRKMGVDVCFTPMMIAEGFNRSQQAREADFSTNSTDQPVVAQFGTRSPVEFALAAERIKPYVQAVDLNCGCPQTWAIREGIGSALIREPQLVKEMVSAVRARCGNDFPVSVKIRVRADIKKTIELVQSVEAAGVAWITVHGRTPQQRKEPVDYEAIKTVKEHAKVPIVANGDIFSHQDIWRVSDQTGVDGVMSARGALANPALFATPGRLQHFIKSSPAPWLPCAVLMARDYLTTAASFGGSYQIHHHHLQYLTYPHLTRADRREFSQLKSLPAVVDYFDSRGWLSTEPGKEIHTHSSKGVKRTNDTNSNSNTNLSGSKIGGRTIIENKEDILGIGERTTNENKEDTLGINHVRTVHQEETS